VQTTGAASSRGPKTLEPAKSAKDERQSTATEQQATIPHGDYQTNLPNSNPSRKTLERVHP
jgi:hypothetical protein